MSVALNRAANERAFRLIPVLLPGLDPFEPANLPPFLATRTWVDLRAGPDSERGLQDLVNAVLGVPFGAPAVPEPEEGPCPYRGLDAFEEKHARYYFGREGHAQRLVEQLKRSRIIAVVGPSGSGKTSLVQAGLLPRVRAGELPGGEQWRVVVLRPGSEPLVSLAAHLLDLDPGPGMQNTVEGLASDGRTLHLSAAKALRDDSPDNRLLLVVDQAEELFTLCRDEVARLAFLENLHHAAVVPGGRTAVVLTLRADFYARLAQFPGFAQLAQSHQLLVGALDDDALRAVIEEPARAVGLDVEQGLVETILAEIVREPGSLPLLEHALLETWRLRRGRLLTLEGYRATGGVQRGLAERADKLYAELTPECRRIAEDLLLRLTQPGEGTEDTRRRIELSEVASRADGELVEDVVRRFVGERLLTTSSDERTGERWVEVTQALIRGWPLLRGWIDADRAGLVVHRRLTGAAGEWQRLGRDNSALHRGLPLAEARAWRDRHPDRLNRLETEFLVASETADRRSRTARRRRLITAFVALTLALTVISVVAVVAVGQRDLAVSRQLAAGAENALGIDPSLSLALALRAVNTARTTQAEEVLRRATDEARALQVLRVDGGPVLGARFLPDERRVVTASDDGRLQIWDLATGRVLATVTAHVGRAYRVRPSPDGRWLLSAGQDGAAVLTEVATGTSRVVARAATGVQMRNVAFSRDGRMLAAAASDGVVRVLDADSGRQLLVADTGTQPLDDVAFSPDAGLLAVAGEGGTAQVLRTSDATRYAELDGHPGRGRDRRVRPLRRSSADRGRRRHRATMGDLGREAGRLVRRRGPDRVRRPL